MARTKGPMALKTAQRFFAASMVLVTLSTFTAIAGLGAVQAMCHDNWMAEYWTPAYTAFMSSGLKPFKCTWFQIGQWWGVSMQLGFWLGMLNSWASGFLERHMPGNVAAGAGATVMCVMSALAVMDNANYYTGKAYDVGGIAFWGFFACPIMNGFVALSYCELLWSMKHVAATLPAGTSASLLPLGDSEAGSDGTQGSGTAAKKDRRLTDESFV